MGCIRERDIGGWPICVGYGILTVSDQGLGYCGSGYPRLAPRPVSSSRSTQRWQRASFSQQQPDRQVGAMPARRRQIERPPRRRHIRSGRAQRRTGTPGRRGEPDRYPASKAQTKPFQSPSPRVVLRHQLRAGREVGKPNIEPVVERTAFLPNATAQCGIRAPLATRGFTQADDPQGRDATIAVRARAGLLFVFCPAGPMWANG